MSEQLRPDAAPPFKTAELVARRIESDIVDAGWEIGSLLGSEVELIERYGVSRGVLREAIRILEHHFVVRTRRGRGGGLIVTEPDSSTVAQSMKLYLQYRRVTADEIHAARLVAEMACVELAAERIGDGGRLLLKEHIATEAQLLDGRNVHQTHLDFHVLVGELSGNPVLDLNVRSIASLVDDWYGDDVGDQESATAAHRAHKSIANAIAAGDVDAAARRLRRHLDAMAPHLRWKQAERRSVRR